MKLFLLAIKNFILAVLGIALDFIVVVITSIVLSFFYSVWTGIVYFTVAMIAKPFIAKIVVSETKKVEITNRKIGQNLYLYSIENGKIEECISTVSFFVAEQLNNFMNLFLNNKHLNYIAMVIASYMVMIYYDLLYRNNIINEDARSFTNNINMKVHSEINNYNHSINDSYKKHLKEKTSDIVNRMIDLEKNDRNKLQNFTTTIITEYLRDQSEFNNKSYQHFQNYLESVSTKFTNCVKERNNIPY